MNKPMLSVDELADHLGVSVATVRWWLNQDTAPAHYKIGRRIKFDPDDVDQWLQHRRHGGSAA